ncbi:N-formylmethionyl-tRNA deformylase,SNF2 family N-terminal domain [Chlamydia poikilotherma]|uniref:N-formylmethionyl-tRNA deformylase,SNF2 family N-terminal domain n=1 Tax=Chlamydia poikilotherma TaxID=1967783 RepID=A0A3B0PQM2_9CHLA|nr:DEAD/DEAH box helicase [Chlamydia poikilotherma]SYX09390.1 N-formylmethionyl-tRNA deformylase,SNF2 family N-terminal domain [Chlamydia poikilotherma]
MVLNALAGFRQTAMDYLATNRQNIALDFSGDCYSIRIPDEDSPDGNWVSTLKFSGIDNLTFASCSCPDGDCCVHLMTAFFSAYDAHGWLPLHHKFDISFWYALFWKLFIEEAKLNAHGDRHYSITSSHATLEISALSPEAFTEWLAIIHQTPEPKTYTEKTFPQSVLYRIAKRFFFFSEAGARLDLIENSQGFPTHFAMQWEGISLKGEILDFATLEDLFPKINFSQTSLSGNYNDFSVTAVRVAPEESKIYFTITSIAQDYKNQPITTIGSVGYITGSQQVILTSQETFVSIYVISLLPENLKKQILSLLHYDSEERPIRYSIYFLRDSSISFSAYLDTPRDLENGKLIYPDFCYVPERGLFTVTGLLSSQISFVVKVDQVEEFLGNEGLLIREPGFEVFTDRVPEGQLTYNITQQGVLLFHYNTGDPAAIDIHYGPWTYYSGQGFFLQRKADLEIQDGLIVEANQIPSFIMKHEVVLRTIQNFFAPTPPLKNLFFEVHKETKGSGLYLKPIFQGLEEENCRLFGVFLYRENLGFNLLPTPLQSLCSLPKKIPPEQVPEFINQNFHNDKLVFADPQLCPPETFELVILAITRPHPSSPLHLHLELKTNIGSIPLGIVLQALRNKKAFAFTKAGFLNFQHCLFQFLKQFISAQKCLISENTVIATVTDIFKLDALAPLSTHEKVNASTSDLAFFSQLKAACLPPIPQSLFSTDHKLRPYQNSGLLWLWFLYNHRLSGLLCDEMGLGKTHQATALLDIVFQSAEPTERPKFLVVCPTSVLPHWEHTLATHLPTVSIFAFHGPNKPELLPPTDVIITSYGTLRQNYAKFYKISFTVTVFDEIHMAKNKNSQIHKILCRLDSQMKLGLTGTPIENNLLEFKGLLDIILPNYLPSDALFKKLFTKKNTAEIDDEIIPSQDLLLKLTRPFILRRTKKLVLPELPEKVESIIPCTLSPEQKKLYLSTLKREKAQIQQLESPEEQTVNYLHVFALLNHLKQICNHPAIFFKNPDKYREHESGKWEAFVRLLHESLSSGYKVVVFSQYIHMIRIIMLYLEEIGVKYASIQGKSLNRKEEIEYFTTDPECRVFVGSLLAAGTGINLTAGNVVIMYDRWWNPAKENQALDRVHRIGQKNTVFIYKLMTEDTLEERIHYLIEKKIRLLDKVISTQDSNILHMLNREDLITILSYKDERNGVDDPTNSIPDDTEESLL